MKFRGRRIKTISFGYNLFADRQTGLRRDAPLSVIKNKKKRIIL